MQTDRRLLLVFLALLVPACGPGATSGTVPGAAPAAPGTARANRELAGLLELMGQRLELMHEVARFKWIHGSAVEDRAREEALLEDVAGRGRDLGLDEGTTRAFFKAQIEAAKIVQRIDLERWRKGLVKAPGTAPDLKGVLRPRIDTLNRSLLAALSRSRAERVGQRPDPVEIERLAKPYFSAASISAEARAAAIAPLLAPAPPRPARPGPAR